MKKLLIILLFLPFALQAQLPDRSLHIGAGMFAGSWGSWVGSVYTPSPEKAFLIGMSITTLAGVGKESIDYGTGGKVEMRDFGNSMFGGLIGAGLVYMGMKIFQSNVPYLSFSDKSLTVGIKIKI